MSTFCVYIWVRVLFIWAWRVTYYEIQFELVVFLWIKGKQIYQFILKENN